MFLVNWPMTLLAAVLALGGSMLVSYARTRGEALGVSCKERLMQRAERHVLLAFHAPAPGRVHRRKVRVRHDHLVPQRLEMRRDPLALRRGLTQNARRRPVAEHRAQSLAARRDPELLHRPLRPENAQLTLAFVQVEFYRIHGGWPPGLCLVGRR